MHHIVNNIGGLGMHGLAGGFETTALINGNVDQHGPCDIVT